MNKNELVRAAAEKTGFTLKETEKTLEAILDAIQTTVAAGDKVQLIGFGGFEPRDRLERVIVSPLTKEKMTIPATRVPAFKPGKTFKDAVAASVAKKSKKKK